MEESVNQWNNEKVITTRSEHGWNTCWPGRSLRPHGPLSGWLTRLLNSCQWWRDLWDPGQHRGLSFGIFVPLAPALKSAADIWTHTHTHSYKLFPLNFTQTIFWNKSLASHYFSKFPHSKHSSFKKKYYYYLFCDIHSSKRSLQKLQCDANPW